MFKIGLKSDKTAPFLDSKWMAAHNKQRICLLKIEIQLILNCKDVRCDIMYYRRRQSVNFSSLLARKTSADTKLRNISPEIDRDLERNSPPQCALIIIPRVGIVLRKLFSFLSSENMCSISVPLSPHKCFAATIKQLASIFHSQWARKLSYYVFLWSKNFE